MVAGSRSLAEAGVAAGTPSPLRRDVIPVTLAVFGRMAGNESIAGVVIDEARKQALALRVGPRSIFVMVGRKLGLDGVPGCAVNQRRMLAGISNSLVLDLTDIERVRQDLVDVTARKGQTTRPRGRGASHRVLS